MKRRCICEYFDRALTMPEIIREARHPGSVPQITRTNPSQPIDPMTALYRMRAELEALADLGRLPRKP